MSGTDSLRQRASLNSLGDNRVEVRDDTGVITTSFEEQQKPTQITPPIDNTQDQASKDALQFDLDMLGSQQSTEELAAREEKRLAELVPAERFGEFVPKTLREFIDTNNPSMGVAFREQFSDGLIGWLTTRGNRFKSLSEIDRMKTEIDNYREQHPFRSFAGEAMGAIVSDSPVDLALMLGTGGLGNGILWAARTGKVGNAAFRQMAGSVIRLKRAYAANQKGRVLNSAIARFGTQFVEGAIAGSISEGIQQATGKRGDIGDVIDRAVLDGVASGPLHQAFRTAGKLSRGTFNAFKKSSARRIAKTVSEDTGVDRAKIEKAIRDSVDEQPLDSANPSVPRATPRSDGGFDLTRGARTLDQGKLDKLNKNVQLKNTSSMKKFFNKVIGGTPNQRALELTDVMNSRKKAVFSKGAKLNKFLERNNYDTSTVEGVDRILDDNHRIMQARMDNDKRADVIKDISDIILGDLGDSKAKILRVVSGAGDDIDSKLTPEQAAELSQAVDKFFATGIAPEVRGKSKREVKEALGSVAGWLLNVYSPDEKSGRRIYNAIAEARAEGRTDLREAFPDQVSAKTKSDFFNEVKEMGAQAEEDIPLSKAAKNNFMKSFLSKTSVFGFNNMTTDSILDSMGSTYSMFRDKFQNARVREDQIKKDLFSKMTQRVKELGVDSEDLTAMGDEVEISVGNKVFRTTRNNALNLHLNARAKSQAELEQAVEGVAEKPNYSNREALRTRGYVFEEGKKPVKFKDDELDVIASDSWLEGNAGNAALNLRDAYRETLNDARDLINDFMRGRIGKDYLDPNIDDYWMKLSEIDLGATSKQLQDKIDNMLDKLSTGDITGKNSKLVIDGLFGSTSLNHTRQGNSALVAQDPSKAMIKYIDSLARMVAFGDDLSQLALVSARNRPTISRELGNQYNDALTRIIAKTSNASSSSLERDFTKLGFAAYRNYLLAALSYNITTPLKQVPSYLTAATRLGINKDEATGSFIESMKYVTGDPRVRPSTKDPDHAMLMESSPTYYNRFARSGQGADVHDVQSTSDIHKILFGENKLSTVFKKRGFKEGFMDFVEKGMIGIQEMDALTVRAIHRSVRKELGADASADAIEKRFAQILDETQPTFHPTTRSLNQMSDQIMVRGLAMFSSQPVKNFNLLLRDWTTYLHNKDPEAKAKALKTTALIAMQAAAITAIGQSTGALKEGFFSNFRSEESQDRRDAFFEDKDAVSRLTGQFIRDSFGTIPGLTGATIGNLVSGLAGMGAFEIDALILSNINDAIEISNSIGRKGEVSSRDVAKILDSTGQILAVPKPITKLAKESLTNL